MKKIYLSPERRPAPHGPYFGYPTLFEHDVTTSIAQKTAAALTRCGFSVKMAPPAATVRVRVAEAFPGRLITTSPSTPMPAPPPPGRAPPAARRSWPMASPAASAGAPAK